MTKAQQNILFAAALATVRDLPKSWTRDKRGDKPVFELCGFRVIETVDGRFIAVKDGT
jgi:hypothetical protein